MAAIGRYEIIQKLGEGGMGTVLLARDPLLERSVAIKLISNHAMAAGKQSEWLRIRFLQEAKAIALLNHPAIVSIFDLGEHNGFPYIVMEYVRGQNLCDLLRRRPLRPIDVIHCVKTVASALDYAHSQHVIHRDIKPANLLVSETGILKVTDFGLAKLATTLESTNTAVVGTLPYMAPEQLNRSAEPQSDQYALASIAYELLVGRPVFQAESEAAFVYKICHEAPKPPNIVRPDIRIETARILERGLLKIPAQRFPTCIEFARALEISILGGPELRAASPKPAPRINLVPAAPVSVPSFTIESPAGNGKTMLIGASALLCGGMGLMVFVQPSRSHVAGSATMATAPSIEQPAQPNATGAFPGPRLAETRHTDVHNGITAGKPTSSVRTNSVVNRSKTAPALSQVKSEKRVSGPLQQQAAYIPPLPTPLKKEESRAPLSTTAPLQDRKLDVSADGRLVWTGTLEAGQQIDLSQSSSQGSVSGTLPGVPVSIEIHPSSVRVVKPPGPENDWRQIVVQNDNTKRSLVLVKWSVIRR